MELVNTEEYLCEDEAKIDSRTSNHAYDVEENENKFLTYRSAFKVALWSVFDPGHPEVVGCSVEVPRHLAMLLWFSYQTIIAIVLLNLLIALMNATINSIQSNKMKQWKFARTSIWLQYFHRKTVLPAPFNLVGYFVYYCTKIFDNCTKTAPQVNNSMFSTKDDQEKKREYIKLVGKLCKKYLIMKEDSRENEVTREDLDNAKRDILKEVKKDLDNAKRDILEGFQT